MKLIFYLNFFAYNSGWSLWKTVNIGFSDQGNGSEQNDTKDIESWGVHEIELGSWTIDEIDFIHFL